MPFSHRYSGYFISVLCECVVILVNPVIVKYTKSQRLFLCSLICIWSIVCFFYLYFSLVSFLSLLKLSLLLQQARYLTSSNSYVNSRMALALTIAIICVQKSVCTSRQQMLRYATEKGHPLIKRIWQISCLKVWVLCVCVWLVLSILVCPFQKDLSENELIALKSSTHTKKQWKRIAICWKFASEAMLMGF